MCFSVMASGDCALCINSKLVFNRLCAPEGDKEQVVILKSKNFFLILQSRYQEKSEAVSKNYFDC